MNRKFKILSKIGWCVSMVATIAFSPLSAQEAATLYFLDKNPTLHQLNPAFRPEGRIYVGIPGLSALHLSAGNDCLTFGDLFQGATVDGEKQTVSFLSRYADNGIDNFLDAMNDKLRLYSDYNMTLLSFGINLKQKHYLSFGLSNRTDVQIYIPKSIPAVLLKGNPDIDAQRSFGIDDLSLAASLYTELAFGYSRQLDERLALGGKLKFLLGHANIRTDFSDMSLTIDKDEWKLTGGGEIEMSAPGLRLQKADDGTFDGFDFDGGSVSGDGLINGLGAAVDLGVSYRLLPELNLSASLLDLGFIRWNSNLRSLRKKTDFVFDGVVYKIEDRDTVDYIDEYEEIFKRMYTINNSAGIYATWLTAKALLGAEYGVWEDRLSFGLLSKTTILQSRLYEEMMVSANFKPWRIFSAALSYSFGEWHNIGLATNFNFGPVNFYLALDQVPLRYASGGGMLVPTKTHGANFSMGCNYIIGYKEKKDDAGEILPVDVMPEADSVGTDSISVLPSDTMVKEVALVVSDTVPADTVVAEVPPAVSDTVSSDTLKPAVDVLEASRGTAVLLPADTVLAEVRPAIADTVPSDSLKPKAETPAVAQDSAVQSPTSSSELIEEALYGIRYSLDQHSMALDKACLPLLDKVAKHLKEHPELNLSVRSHFHLDERGQDFSNFMARERARLVRSYIVEQGVDAERIVMEVVGPDEPVASNRMLAGRAKNRRMELRYVPAKPSE